MNKLQQKLLDLKISKKLPFWNILPIVIFITAIIVFATVSIKSGSTADGFGLGIDFTGGTEMTVQVADTKDNENLIRNVVQNDRANAPKIDYIQGVSTGGTDGIRIKFKNTIEDTAAMKDLNDAIMQDIYDAFEVENNAENVSFVTYTNTSKTASVDLIKKAVLALVIALVLIMIYIVVRFEWLSGVAAIIALLHDVVMMICLTVICRIPVNSSFIAAIITIVAYSINNTIIVFDRVRERKKNFDKKSIRYADVADEAISMTINRTMFTSVTTMIMVIMLTILGVASMRNFTLPIMFGLLAGTYSSMFLAAPTWAAMNNGILKYRAKQLAKYKAQK